MGVVPEDSDGIYSPSSGLTGARELTPAGRLSQDPCPGVWARVGGRWDERSGLPEEVCMTLTSSDFGKGGLFGKAWLCGLQAASGEGGMVRGMGRSTCPVPPAGAGGLPTVPALACAGLLVLGVQLALG